MSKSIVRILVVGALLLGACGSSGDLEIEDVWARTSAMNQQAGAVYMTITGGGEADRLISASVSSDVAMVAEVHETSADDDGMMSMQEVPAVDVPADGSVSLEPGGFHIMLMQLAEPLEDGGEIELTLTFENAGEVDITAEIRDE